VNIPTLKKPNVFLPLLLSFAALTLVLGHAALYGVVQEADEGTPAHIFQLLMLLQIPLVASFAITWLPRAPRPTMKLLALQAGAALAAVLAVVYFT